MIESKYRRESIRFNPKINKIYKPLKKNQLLAMILSTGVLILKFLIVIEIQKIVDSISVLDFNLLQMQLYTCFFLVIMFFLINCIFQYVFRNLQYTSHYILIKGLFGISLTKDYFFYEKYVPSAILSMVKEDSKFIADWKSIGLITMFFNIVTVIFVFTVMSTYNLLFTIANIFIIILCLVVTHYISKVIGQKIYDLQVSNTIINQKMVDYLNGIKDIKQHKKEKFFQNKLAYFIDNNTYKYSNGYSKYFSFYMSIFALLSLVLPIVSILIGVFLIFNNQFTIGKLIATYMLVGYLQEPVMVIPDYLNKRLQAIAIQDKILPLLKDCDKVKLNEKVGRLKEFTFQSKEYLFEDGKSILKNISFALSRGGVILIKGESGKGKTSLLNLLSKFYSMDEQEVEIKYNDVPVETIPFSVYYDHVLQAQQIPYVFNDSILNNIVLGEKYPDKDINEILYTTCLEGFVQTKGIDYLIAQNGENISGGQKQRIGLARTLLKKPDILMLDEPTSALDVELISTITKRIANYCEKYEIGLIIVSHNDSFEQYYKEHKHTNVTTVIL